MRERSFGGDTDQKAAWRNQLEVYRAEVLRRAQPQPGETLLDVGSGDGLIALGAVPLVGEAGKVIFSDVSPALLKACRAIVEEMHVEERCEFVEASADDLAAIANESVDVVTTRSVLIYVRAKDRAFSEFFRVLRHGGRMSIFEPINRYFEGATGSYWGFDVSGIEDLVEKLEATYHSRDPSDPGPMMDFDERDLVRLAEAAGFWSVSLDLEVRIEPGSWFTSWSAMLKMAGNPLDPTLEEAMKQALSPEEAERFERRVRPQVEAGMGIKRYAYAYLLARK